MLGMPALNALPYIKKNIPQFWSFNAFMYSSKRLQSIENG